MGGYRKVGCIGCHAFYHYVTCFPRHTAFIMCCACPQHFTMRIVLIFIMGLGLKLFSLRVRATAGKVAPAKNFLLFICRGLAQGHNNAMLSGLKIPAQAPAHSPCHATPEEQGGGNRHTLNCTLANNTIAGNGGLLIFVR